MGTKDRQQATILDFILFMVLTIPIFSFGFVVLNALDKFVVK